MSRVLVVGAGATGGFFGAHLARAHRDVTFLVRPARAALLRREGLHLSTPQGDTVLAPRWVTAETVDGCYNIILLSVKADALPAALEDLAPAVGETSVIVPFLNGTDHIDVIEKRFPGHLLGGVVKVVAQLTADGTIKVSGPTATMEIGELTGRISARVRRTSDVLDVDGYEVSISDGIHTAMWHKWVFISTVTTICCLATGTIGEVAATSSGEEFATAVLAESAAIAEAAGHPLSAAGYEALRATVTQARSPFAPSLYRDMMDGRATEVESVLASLSSVADRLGVSAPLVALATLRLRLHNRRVASPAG
ncbi:ketopantoate reductase family protein [Streptomyces galilaeus]|uniref:ketopantoate reductase family protein n=1 Tax=Streptomyces galilaeus TaxID=33899 RepID=UPI0038F67EF2